MKNCKEPGCCFSQFGGGFCQRHQFRRTDKKRKPIAKRVVRTTTKHPGWGYISQVEMFKDIFFHARKPVICPISKRNITDLMDGPITQWLSMYAHVLPKSTYSLFKLNPDNIVMINPVAHNILDQGTAGERKNHPDWDWGFWDNKVEEMKLKYKLYKRDNQL